MQLSELGIPFATFVVPSIGSSVAGIDTGESYGSPEGVKAAEALHAEMVRRGYATKPAVLGRSRGGVWPRGR